MASGAGMSGFSTAAELLAEQQEEEARLAQLKLDAAQETEQKQHQQNLAAAAIQGLFRTYRRRLARMREWEVMFNKRKRGHALTAEFEAEMREVAAKLIQASARMRHAMGEKRRRLGVIPIIQRRVRGNRTRA